MRDKGMVALGRVVLSKRERVIALQPWDKGLLGATLRYASEVRDASDYFDELPNVKIDREMLKLAEHILNTKKADFDPTEFVDHYEEALVELLRKKQEGVPLAKARVPTPPRNVANLMDTLKRSIAADSKKPKSKKRIPGQGEMLLPISGKKSKDAEAMLLPFYRRWHGQAPFRWPRSESLSSPPPNPGTSTGIRAPSDRLVPCAAKASAWPYC
jgi:DNA end-binding protein Ku